MTEVLTMLAWVVGGSIAFVFVVSALMILAVAPAAVRKVRKEKSE
jgi:hypothetical protein